MIICVYFHHVLNLGKLRLIFFLSDHLLSYTGMLMHLNSSKYILGSKDYKCGSINKYKLEIKININNLNICKFVVNIYCINKLINKKSYFNTHKGNSTKKSEVLTFSHLTTFKTKILFNCISVSSLVSPFSIKYYLRNAAHGVNVLSSRPVKYIIL